MAFPLGFRRICDAAVVVKIGGSEEVSQMKVLVCGSRNWTDGTRIWEALDLLKPDEIIEGCARGADHWAELWAEDRRVPIQHFPADWYRFGPAAGPQRNEMMLARGKPDVVVAFSMGTKGTADMINRAGEARVPINVYFDKPFEVADVG